MHVTEKFHAWATSLVPLHTFQSPCSLWRLNGAIRPGRVPLQRSSERLLTSPLESEYFIHKSIIASTLSLILILSDAPHWLGCDAASNPVLGLNFPGYARAVPWSPATYLGAMTRMYEQQIRICTFPIANICDYGGERERKKKGGPKIG